MDNKNDQNKTSQNNNSTKSSKTSHNSNNKQLTQKQRHALAAALLIGSAIVVGIVATLLGGKLKENYIKPPAYAPDWLFPVVWSILYISIGIAAYIAYIDAIDHNDRKFDVICYSIHMFFNFMWPLFFFTLNWLIFSCVWLLFVVITAIIVTYRYYKANIYSGIMFTVYTIWLLYAMYLSLGVTILNV